MIVSPLPAARSPRTLTRIAVLAAAVLAALVALAGPAAAAPKTGTVVPLLDCVIPAADGSFTAVLGYDNTESESVKLNGSHNRLRPGVLDGAQSDRFEPGVHHAAFTVTVGPGVTASWTLDGHILPLSGDATSCPPETEMPATGNGTGAAIAIGIAGVVGVALLARSSRRRSDTTA